jgi:hypothetical protein
MEIVKVKGYIRKPKKKAYPVKSYFRGKRKKGERGKK